MKLIACLLTTGAIMFAGSALADANDSKPAIKIDQAAPAHPVPGKTSFTEGEAKDRIEKHGYVIVTNPLKGDRGIWYAQATKDGKAVRLMVDYQGNVFERASPQAPMDGRTHLTASRALARMESRGYNIDSNPIKDDQGIWYAEGIKDNGRIVQVMVDYQGNVFESGEYSGHQSSAPGLEPTLPNPIRKAPAPTQPLAQ